MKPRGRGAASDGDRCDFQFHDAFAMYDNMDLVLAYMRTSPKYSDLDIRYALLSEYFDGKLACAVPGIARACAADPVRAFLAA